MAYIHGTGSASEDAAQKQAGAAAAADQLAVLDRALRTLSPQAKAAFMQVFADGVTRAADAVVTRSGSAKAAPAVINKAAGMAGGKDRRVAKQARKKKGGRPCFCGRTIPPGAKKCPNPDCGRLTRKGFEAGLRKAAAAQRGPAVITKAAASPVGQSALPRLAWDPAASPNPATREAYRRMHGEGGAA